MRLLYVPMVMAVMSALVTTNSGFIAKPATWMTTTGAYGQNLNGKMFTLSVNRGGISFYAPYFYSSTHPWPSTPSYPTRSYTTGRPGTATARPRTTSAGPRTTSAGPRTTTSPRWTTNYPSWTTTYPYSTTAPPTGGVSVCLRYLTDSLPNPIFTLSPSSRNPMVLRANNARSYALSLGRYSYYSMYLSPEIRFWSNIGSDIWTRVCVTVDSVKNVAQVFSGSSISIRKMLPIRYVWTGEPVIDFSAFDGQVTDIQVWDYPLRYKEIFNYMTSGVYASYRGNVLTWSDISYSPRGNALLEDTYEWQARQPISSRRRGRRPKGERKPWELFNVMESEGKQTAD